MDLELIPFGNFRYIAGPVTGLVDLLCSIKSKCSGFIFRNLLANLVSEFGQDGLFGFLNPLHLDNMPAKTSPDQFTDLSCLHGKGSI